MGQDREQLPAHPAGEQPLIEQVVHSAAAIVDSWAGPVRVEWDDTAALTPHGQIPFFIDYLKVAGLFDGLVADCPLAYRSPNAPKKRDVLGTALISLVEIRQAFRRVFDPDWS